MNRAQMLFKAEGSVRYHRARASYFDALNKWLTGIGFFLGAGVVVTTFAAVPGLAIASGFLVVILNAYRFVGKPDQAAADHKKSCRDWEALLGKIQSASSPREAELKNWILHAHDLDSASFEDMKAV